MTDDIRKYTNPSINPGDDFFKFATEYWINYHKWNKVYPSWNTFTALTEKNNGRIEKIIKTEDSSEISKKITALYNISMNWKKRNIEGNVPLVNYLNKYIYSIDTKEKLFDFCAEHHSTLFFAPFIAADSKHPDMNIVHICQEGLSLGNKDYYILNDPEIEKIRKAFKKYAIRLFMYVGYSRKYANINANRLWEIESELAEYHYSEEDQRKPELTYHLEHAGSMSEPMEFDLPSFLNKYYGQPVEDFIICEKEAVYYGCHLMESLSLQDLKLVLEWNAINYSVNKLDDKIYKIGHEFNKAFDGKCRMPSRKRRSISLVNNIFSEAIGQMYVKKYFDEESKQDVINMVYNMTDSFKNILAGEKWMSDETKSRAIEKLKNIKVKIGYPDKIEDYSDCPIDETISFFENRLNINDYFFWKDVKKNFNNPVDKDEWHMDPQQVNAYYSQNNNEICFPAGILQYPFYSKKRSPEFNYGAIGVIIGHEMTHGFDNHGRMYNEKSELADWWKPEESDAFNNLSDNTLKHFESLEVLPGLKCNAGLALSENLADYGGLKIAYDACEKACKNIGWEWDRRFFISFAVCWAGVATEEYIRSLTLDNEHSINYIRVNGTLPLFDKWYKAFNITEKDKLYIAPEKRAKIW
ncbi:MAG: Neutral endopeptidase [Wendovervirus sonii]|uniref:Neutral endopeptidase n=1 Tax=phage Lak_Megaphage_Sonny TaxID=3109229 RepID=A0ABZ0Z336_9CAUD|nr:MAG: Neutral endopeptidase [phage Lak_Megaphage_Sonny]